MQSSPRCRENLVASGLQKDSFEEMKRAQQFHGHWSLIKLVVLVSIMSIPAQGFQSTNMGSRANKMIQNPAIGSILFAQKQDTVATRKRKQKNRKNSLSESKSRKGLSESDLRQHVSAQYVNGPGGILRPTVAKQRRRERQRNEVDEHIKQLHKLDRHPALVLNADYQPISYLPLSMWHWQEAIKAVFSGKVTVVDIYPDVVIRAANLEIPLPSVIALNEYVKQPNNRPAFTKKNVFLRDQYTCQYCSHRFHTRDLSLDHVMPRSMGGILSWENVVTSCRKCNGKKGSLTVNQLRSVGMRLLREPYTPTQFQLHNIAGRMLPKKVPSAWAPYLGLANDSSATINPEEGLMFEDIH